MVKESKKRFDLTGGYKDRSKEEVEAPIRADKGRIKRLRMYVNAIRKDFRKDFPERGWHFPEEDDIMLDELK